MGCDTVVRLDLFVKHTSYKEMVDSICDNMLPYTNYGFNVNATGIYYDTLTNVMGCDSVVRLDLFVKHTSYKELVDMI